MENTLRRLSASFYFVCLLLVLACFYFSLFDELFIWLAPDELAASGAYRALGFWDCAKNYYFSTTVNRLSADVAVCLMAKAAAWNTPYLGWLFARLVCYTLIPVSLIIFLKEVLSIPLRWGVIIACMLMAIAFYLIAADTSFSMLGLDLAIYATATWTYFLLAAYFHKSMRNNLYFIWFCLIYAINLNSQEVFLVISAGFIPLFAYYRHPISSWSLWLKAMFRDRKVWVLLSVYILSALSTLLAPGLAMRQSVWPSTGVFADGVGYIFLAVEEASALLIKNAFWLLGMFLLGGGSAILTSHAYSCFKTGFILWVFIFCPLYLFVFNSILAGNYTKSLDGRFSK